MVLSYLEQMDNITQPHSILNVPKSMCPFCAIFQEPRVSRVERIVSLIPKPSFFKVLRVALRELFTLTPSAAHEFNLLWGSALTASFKVAVQVRRGPPSTSRWRILSNEGEDTIYSCAKQLIRNQTNDAQIFVVADDPSVRARAAQEFEEFGSQISYLGLPVADHTEWKSLKGKGLEFRASLYDWWILGEMDEAILTDAASFGYSGFARSRTDKLPITVWSSSDKSCLRRVWGSKAPVLEPHQEQGSVWKPNSAEAYFGV
mmetsp:Transcript_21938/g.34372  ORF Transcript_21938/g.34372 Transcript_21938/m.34372 type:complete len:260 (-) Transcript_21938:998-1777(-)|eukprot:CAMPEP_0184317398 /NCGR_PEP_ID=MMETSP1049-20130417/96376_1 /TAXON_ID=77928 /ORGANISM="Proteomonas sulcata, Strain CCMP704" /LENGTH=259 /DNA_ID=CAMNT_0026636769 /DNA_START=151 /DNA_END=930 /DNA_ORIENTATION=-